MHDPEVIDLTEARLVRQVEDAPDAVTAEVALSLLALYKSGDIEVEMVEGRMMYRLTGGSEGGPDLTSEGASTDASESPSAGPST